MKSPQNRHVILKIRPDKLCRCCIPLLCAAALLFSACGCAAPRPPSHFEETGIEWNLSEINGELAGEDEYEGLNRAIFECQHWFMAYFIRPIGGVYGSIMPRFMVRGFSNMFRNLEFPRRAVSALAQGKTKASGVESMRFLANTTLGVAGFFDVGQAWFGLPEHDEDFGQAFEAAGMARGTTLILPKGSGTSLRDLLGAACDAVLDGKSYIPYAGTFAMLNGGVAQYRVYSRLVEANSDPYEMYKTFAVVQRRLKFVDFPDRVDAQTETLRRRCALGFGPAPSVPPPAPRPAGFHGNWVNLDHYAGEFPDLDTLRVVMHTPQRDDSSIWPHLSLFNDDFTRQARFGSVAVLPDRPRMDYYFWEQDGRPDAPLVVVVPGIASHYTNPSAVAFAELFFHNGYQAATVSNAFCWQFIESAGSGDFPGDSVRDAADVKRAVFAMIDDIAKDYRHQPKEIILVGYSLGALHLLHLAAQEAPDDRYRISRYVAINPPADMRFALGAGDAMAASSRNWTREEAIERTTEAMGVYFALSSRPHPTYEPDLPERLPEWYYRVPLSVGQARFLSGLSLRMALRDILYTAVKKYGRIEYLNAEYRWNKRTRLYREIDKVSFADYMSRYVLPSVNRDAATPLTGGQLARRAGLYSIAAKLADNPRIRVLHNMDDFLLSERDKQFLDATFGPRLTWFDRGGHLGNLYLKQYSEVLLRQIPSGAPDSKTTTATEKNAAAPAGTACKIAINGI